MFEPNANWYLNKTLRQYYIQNEKEKKQQHNERILELNHGNFTRLEFSIYMSMAREFSTFCNRLAIEITENYKNYINQLFQIQSKIPFHYRIRHYYVYMDQGAILEMCVS